MRSHDTLLLSLSLFFFFFMTPYFTSYPLHPFLPYLVHSSFYLPLTSLLWRSLFLGILMDLSSTTIWGLTPLAYSLATYIIFRKFRIREFSHPRFLIMTLLFTILCDVIRSLLFFDRLFSLNWLEHLFVYTPLSMALYSLLIVSLPLILWKKIKQVAIIGRKRLIRR